MRIGWGVHVLRRGLANAGGAEKVGKCFALFVSEAVSGAVGFADAVEAEAAEVAAQLAPCGQGPNRSPELKGEWADQPIHTGGQSLRGASIKGGGQSGSGRQLVGLSAGVGAVL